MTLNKRKDRCTRSCFKDLFNVNVHLYCTVNAVYVAACLLRLARMMDKGGGDCGKTDAGREWKGRGGELKELKTKIISAAAEKTLCWHENIR